MSPTRLTLKRLALASIAFSVGIAACTNPRGSSPYEAGYSELLERFEEMKGITDGFRRAEDSLIRAFWDRARSNFDTEAEAIAEGGLALYGSIEDLSRSTERTLDPIINESSEFDISTYEDDDALYELREALVDFYLEWRRYPRSVQEQLYYWVGSWADGDGNPFLGSLSPVGDIYADLSVRFLRLCGKFRYHLPANDPSNLLKEKVEVLCKQ